MISILIPVFNQDVNTLVARLSAGFSHLQQPGEIIVMEDGSDIACRQINQGIAKLPFVHYIVHDQNQGRLRIRRLLAEAAKGEWLLFLDGDSEIQADDWLLKYEQAARNNQGVIVGGRTYAGTLPADCALRLHWKYGRERESRGGHKKHQPAFMTNNFLIEAQYFYQLSFDQAWEGYGHEDTWIGMQLEKAGIPVHYIDNPVVHAGLETSEVFIAKSENALVNLHRLSKKVPAISLAKHVKLFRVYQSVKAWRAGWLVILLYGLLGKYIRKNLHSCNPSLRLFDLYRLHYIIRLNKGR